MTTPTAPPASGHPAIRSCRPDEFDVMLAIINDGAQAYRGVIPDDRWHDPYMSADDLRAEIAAGVRFDGCERDGVLAGVMGIQSVRNVELIRHAYTLSACHGQGIGSALLAHLRARTSRPILIGTWSAATWAVGFYRRHGFALVPQDAKADLLRAYWTVPDRQIDTSVVLAAPALSTADAQRLIAEGRSLSYSR